MTQTVRTVLAEMAAAGMFASTSCCTVASGVARFGQEALPSGFKGEMNLSSAGFKGDNLALKANVCPKPTAVRTKSSTLEVSAILADRPVETLVFTLLFLSFISQLLASHVSTGSFLLTECGELTWF